MMGFRIPGCLHADACVNSDSNGTAVTVCPTAAGAAEIAVVHVTELTLPAHCLSSTDQRGLVVHVGGADCAVQEPGNVKIMVQPTVSLFWEISSAIGAQPRGPNCDDEVSSGRSCVAVSGPQDFYVWSARGGSETNIVVEFSPATLTCP
jgi:hypothetical protein